MAMLPAADVVSVTGHATQVAADVAPVEDEYFAAGQVTQGFSFCAYISAMSLYLPAGHAVHAAVPNGGPSYPTLHEHSRSSPQRLLLLLKDIQFEPELP
jgi:hypothetical protein